MPARKIESVIADHLKTIVDYDADIHVTALDDASEMIKAIEKSGFEIRRRLSPAAQERMNHRRGGRVR